MRSRKHRREETRFGWGEPAGTVFISRQIPCQLGSQPCLGCSARTRESLNRREMREISIGLLRDYACKASGLSGRFRSWNFTRYPLLCKHRIRGWQPISVLSNSGDYYRVRDHRGGSSRVRRLSPPRGTRALPVVLPDTGAGSAIPRGDRVGICWTYHEPRIPA